MSYLNCLKEISNLKLFCFVTHIASNMGTNCELRGTSAKMKKPD